MPVGIEVKKVRCTVFMDTILPFSLDTAQMVKSMLQRPDATPIILPDPQFPTQLVVNWGLMEKESNVLEIRANKIDIYGDVDNNEFTSVFCNFALELVDKKGFNVNRMAFAPTYKVKKDDEQALFDTNLKCSQYEVVPMMDFSQVRVFLKNESLDNIPFSLFYNCTILHPQEAPFTPLREYVIAIDINTKNGSSTLYTKKAVRTFFNHAPSLNSNFLKLTCGE